MLEVAFDDVDRRLDGAEERCGQVVQGALLIDGTHRLYRRDQMQPNFDGSETLFRHGRREMRVCYLAGHDLTFRKDRFHGRRLMHQHKQPRYGLRLRLPGE